MRVIGGLLGSRIFEAPRGRITHPMSDRVRGALFNSLGDLTGMRVLDPYAGSGALSFEAISRGAASAVAIDNNRKAYKFLTKNVESLGLEDIVQATRANCISWSKNNPEEMFEVLLCDPPYTDVRRDVIEHLCSHILPGGIVVVSHPASEKPLKLKSVDLIDNRNYGDAELAYYRAR